MKRRQGLGMLAVAVVVLAGGGLGTASGQTLVKSDVTTLYFGVEVSLPDPAHPDTVDVYHTDLAVPFTGCAWDLHVSFDEPSAPPGGRRIETEDALLYAGTAARVTLASIPAGYGFIGATAGVPFWVLPQNANPGVLYLGWSSEDMTQIDQGGISIWNPNDPRGGANVAGRWLGVALIDVRGPAGGEFSMWQSGAGGAPDAFFSTYEGGVGDVDAFHLLTGGHSHVNFGFTEAGLYEVDVQLSTYLVFDRGDHDCSGGIDLDDYAMLPQCLAGPDQAPTPTDPVTTQMCLNWFDYDEDGDVDLMDWAEFQCGFEG